MWYNWQLIDFQFLTTDFTDLYIVHCVKLLILQERNLCEADENLFKGYLDGRCQVENYLKNGSKI